MLTGAEVLLLCAGGVVTGVINTLAGGGGLLTVPLLVLIGLPGTEANATARVGVLFQCLTATWRFRAAGIPGPRDALPLLPPLLAGALVGALGISRVDDTLFERLFGLLMLPLLVPVLLSGRAAPRAEARRPPPRWLRTLLFFAIGVYGGAIQAGVGILLVVSLAHTGLDLLRANSVKVVVVAAFTAVAVAVFLLADQIVWLPGLLLAASASLGAVLGTRLAVRGGERVIRPALVVAVVALSGRMLGLY